jgi:hypothetical protein
LSIVKIKYFAPNKFQIIFVHGVVEQLQHRWNENR